MTVADDVVLQRVGETVRAVHEGLLNWVDRLLVQAGLEGVQTSSDFPPEGRSAPTMVVFPYRFGPDPLHSTARAVSLLGLGPDHRPGALGIPEPWGQIGALVTEGLLGQWPRDPRGRPPRAARLDDLPAGLRGWYAAAPEWRVEPVAGDELAPLPAAWYVPGLTVATHYLVSAGAATRGVLPTDIEATSLLLSALGALTVAVHHERGFDLLLPAPNAEESFAGYIQALAGDVEAAGSTSLAAALREGAGLLNRRQMLTVEVLPTQELGSAELFSLIQALQRPLKASFCLRVSARLGDVLQFGPAAETRVRGLRDRFLYTPGGGGS